MFSTFLKHQHLGKNSSRLRRRPGHLEKLYSPGLGPGRVRSLTGLVIFLVLVLVIGWGKVYLPPLPPFPGHPAPKCAFPKVVVKPSFAELNPPKTPYVSPFWPPRGGGRSGQRYFSNLLAPRSPKTPQAPPKTPPRPPQDPPKTLPRPF